MNRSRAKEVAAERQLDWLLGERLGAGPVRSRTTVRQLTTVPQLTTVTGLRQRWLVAAVFVLALGAAFGVALLSRGEVGADPVAPAQQGPAAAALHWHEAHGPAALDTIGADVVNLRCFDFDDDALAKLPRLGALERLDLSGMDVNTKGYAVSLPISDVGVQHLGQLQKLRWLSLAGCHSVQGTTLHVLEGLPQLEHLDLTFTGVRSPAVERLARLPVLRELSLSYCMDFHGRSLREVAKLPGLRKLELRGCVTLAAADVERLASLRELRHLDLRDCQGRFRGQTASFGEEPTKAPPVQDGVGVTDEAIAALTDLPLQVLLLAGCEALTDAVGTSLAEFGQLRELDLGGLPKTTPAVLKGVSRALQVLSLDGNVDWPADGLAMLGEFDSLRELGLRGVRRCDDAALATLLGKLELHRLRLGGMHLREFDPGPSAAVRPGLTAASAAELARHSSLRSIELGYTPWVDAEVLTKLAALPILEELILNESQGVAGGSLAALASSRSLRRLDLLGCRTLTIEDLAACAGAPLTELNLRATRLPQASVRELAPKFPGCTIVLSDGQRLQVPR